MEEEHEESSNLQEGRQVEVMDSDEWGRGSGDEDPGLVEEGVERVEFAERREGRAGEGKEDGGQDALISRVFYGQSKSICVVYLERNCLPEIPRESTMQGGDVGGITGVAGLGDTGTHR